jgi:hypothetical protein
MQVDSRPAGLQPPGTAEPLGIGAPLDTAARLDIAEPLGAAQPLGAEPEALRALVAAAGPAPSPSCAYSRWGLEKTAVEPRVAARACAKFAWRPLRPAAGRSNARNRMGFARAGPQKAW